ncbi:MAG: nucleotidyl transferase AbiEii/AbiGii toxin family protein [Planctomycetota bacterium]|jgi:predicted nucleotidyltransferase component of viral defense system
MKEYLKQLIEKQTDPLLQKSIVREYLQARVLQTLQDNGVFLNWAFLGGTALRFLYNIPRYSEDLDFSLVNPEEECNFEKVLKKIKSAFEAENYAVNIKVSSPKTVMSAFIKFPGLLYELGITPHRDESLSIKFEIDTNPPEGGGTATTIVRRFVTVNVTHYDKPSLLAGKLHAVLSRAYTKGRDLYDLVWYLSDNNWPMPNFKLLNAALKQSTPEAESIDDKNIKVILTERMNQLDWKRAKEDLMPFIERQQELELVTKENCLKLIGERF